MWSGRLNIELYDTTLETGDIDIRTTLIQKGLAVAVGTEAGSMDSPGQLVPGSQQTAGGGDVAYIPG